MMVEQTSDESKEVAEQFKRSRDRGCAFLLKELGANGAFPAGEPEVGQYYKTLTAFQVCGHNDAANRLCRWIRAEGMTADGDFQPRGESTSGHAYAYFNAWVILGAHRLGQLDISQRGVDFLSGFHDERTGGFYSSLEEREADTKQDLMVVSMCGLAFLQVGRLEIACRVGAWLKNLMDAQPDFPQRLYTVYSRALGLHTVPEPGLEFRYVVVADARDDQAFFNAGIAASFLCRLFQVTGEKQWLELAMSYMSFAEVASDELFRLIRAGKVGWAASLLFGLSGKEKYREMAIRIGKNLAALQSEQGFWSGVGQTTPSNDSTAERVIWMDEIAQVARM